MKPRNVFPVILFLVWLATCLFFLFSSQYHCNTAAPFIHAKSIYKENWGIIISDTCKEKFFLETDHSARGEGYRYSVLETLGNACVTYQRHNQDTTGVGENDLVSNTLHRIYQQLDIPKNYKYPLSECSWLLRTQEDGSHIVVLHLIEKDIVCIAEELK